MGEPGETRQFRRPSRIGRRGPEDFAGRAVRRLSGKGEVPTIKVLRQFRLAQFEIGQRPAQTGEARPALWAGR
jgi:hypothetical protein